MFYLRIELHPIEANGFVFKSPRLNEFYRTGQERICHPKKQRAVLCRKISHWKRSEFGKIKTIVMRYGIPTSALGAPIVERPRRISVYHAVFTPRREGREAWLGS